MANKAYFSCKNYNKSNFFAYRVYSKNENL